MTILAVFILGSLFGYVVRMFQELKHQTELQEQRNADLATGTPIGSQLAREMGITLK